MKTKIILLCFLIGLPLSCIKDNPSTLGIGLVAFYPFNGNANDESGNNNNGIIYGATLTEDRFGNPESAYNFNGLNNYILVRNPVGLSNSKYSFSLWLNISQLPLTHQCNFILELGYPNLQGHVIAINNQFTQTNPTSGWSVNSPNLSSSRINFQTGILPNINTWYHLTFIRNDTSVYIYENGIILKHVLTNGEFASYPDPVNLYLGSRSLVWDNYFFNGIIDDIRVYNRVLTDSEINELVSLRQ